MRYIDCPTSGGPEVLTVRQGDPPEPKEGEVLVQVLAAGVNRPDLMQRKGQYPPPPGASPILGLEVSGRVAACGPGVDAWRVGDPVCALTPGGGYADYCVAPAGHCLPVPEKVALEEAAGIPETFFTVWSNVFERGRLRAGESLLVHGGTSGIGVAAIQLAKALGAAVLATAGTAEKCRACMELGADLAIPYKERDFVDEVARFTRGRGVDLVLDMVGGDYFSRNLDCLAVDGRLVQIAFMRGAEVPLDLARMMVRRLTVTGSTLRPQSVQRKSEIAAALLGTVWPLFASETVKVVVDRYFAFDEVQEAHRHLERGQHVGKVILRM